MRENINHENHRILNENYENDENQWISCENHESYLIVLKTMKILLFH